MCIGPADECNTIGWEHRNLFHYDYYSHWHRWKKQPVDRLGSAAAEACHEGRLPYTVVASAPCMGSHRFISAIKFQGSQITLAMLDRRYRDYLTCRFDERNSGKVFLSSASYREYRGDCDSVAITEEYTFQEDGAFHFEKHHFQDGALASRTGKMDILWNWEPYPAFGDYDSMLEIKWVCGLGGI
jgi:hypothetical protein